MAPSASVATALVARHAIVQPTSAVVRSASPAIFGTLVSGGSADAMPRGIIGGFRLQCRAMFLWADLVELVHHPFSALRLIGARRHLGHGLVALAVSVTLPAAVSELGALGPYRPPANLGSLPSLTAQGADIYARWVYMHRFLIPVYGIAVSTILWIAAAGVIHLIARALGGRGSFSGLVKLLGYAALIGLVALPVALADALLKLQGNARAELPVGQLVGLVG